MAAPERTLLVRGRTLALGPRPVLMGIVNASPDSFSDGRLAQSLDHQVARARSQMDAGAEIIDVGGESGVTNEPPVDPSVEIERVVPLVRRVCEERDVIVSVDTYKPAVARAAIAAGAAIVNDVSGLRDPSLAEVCAETGAGLVVVHTRAEPKQKLFDPSLDGHVLADVATFLSERMAVAVDRGVSREQLLLDPGPDFGKTPAQTVELLRSFEDLHALGRPLLLAVSRKDFIGAITARPPRDRLAGTLAAIAHGVGAGAHVLRVHDVAAVADFLAVDAALSGELEVSRDARLADELRWEPPRGPG
jgi:dihydropteroate synthase